MPSLTPNTAMRAHLDSQLAILAELSRTSYDSARRPGWFRASIFSPRASANGSA